MLLKCYFTSNLSEYKDDNSRSPILHTGINMFVCNIALSDMVMCLTAAPLTPITSFYGQWYLGELPCKILPAFQVSKIKIIDIKRIVQKILYNVL